MARAKAIAEEANRKKVPAAREPYTAAQADTVRRELPGP
jgi:hypothetical protein